ncbi:hypothetical protein HZH68_014973 [Vespula germanica]|uniref:Uncharacterized protein n=1 Tax=Vespula germanica TaxID=30212 RepID=A0A834J7B7_VESGE|nr:hypothetical protein HZH68_014973 [Vespula germanica]
MCEYQLNSISSVLVRPPPIRRKKKENNKKDCELMSTTATGALSVAKVCSDLTIHWKLVRLRRLAKPLGPDFTGFRRLINFGVAFRAPFVPTVQNSASLRGKYRFSREYLGMSSSELGRL